MTKRHDLEYHYTEILKMLGFDLSNPDFEETPQRIAKVMKYLLRGHTDEASLDLQDHLRRVFPSNYDEMIFIRNVTAYGVCPHHFLPVTYRVDLAYLPQSDVIGASKPVRLIKTLAAKAQKQEDLTNDIITIFDKAVQPRGTAVRIIGQHSCMRIRGIESQDSDMLTIQLSGVLKNPTSKQEFLRMI